MQAFVGVGLVLSIAHCEPIQTNCGSLHRDFVIKQNDRNKSIKIVCLIRTDSSSLQRDTKRIEQERMLAERENRIYAICVGNTGSYKQDKCVDSTQYVAPVNQFGFSDVQHKPYGDR